MFLLTNVTRDSDVETLKCWNIGILEWRFNSNKSNVLGWRRFAWYFLSQCNPRREQVGKRKAFEFLPSRHMFWSVLRCRWSSAWQQVEGFPRIPSTPPKYLHGSHVRGWVTPSCTLLQAQPVGQTKSDKKVKGLIIWSRHFFLFFSSNFSPFRVTNSERNFLKFKQFNRNFV